MVSKNYFQNTNNLRNNTIFFMGMIFYDIYIYIYMKLLFDLVLSTDIELSPLFPLLPPNKVVNNNLGWTM